MEANEAQELQEHAEKSLGTRTGSTTADGMFTLEDAECLADCGRAPCLQVNHRFFGDVTPESFDALVDDLRAGRLDGDVPHHGTLVRVRRDGGLRVEPETVRSEREAMTRAMAMVSHGPARTRPMMMSAKPGTTARSCPVGLPGLPCTVKNPSSAKPSSSGSICQARGGGGVARRVTPSGEIRTRRSASRAATAAATGTPIATMRTSRRLSDSSAGENGLTT